VHIYPKLAIPRGKSGSSIASADARAFAEVWGLSSPQLRRLKLSSSVAWARGWENGPWDRYTIKEDILYNKSFLMDKNIRHGVGEVKQDKVFRWFPSCQWVIDRNPH
jgi:hypothetical protein